MILKGNVGFEAIGCGRPASLTFSYLVEVIRRNVLGASMRKPATPNRSEQSSSSQYWCGRCPIRSSRSAVRAARSSHIGFVKVVADRAGGMKIA